ncbi:single-stranded-DNA-specific exonuclease RecJ [Trichlorobacter sp.]|uniref:single-stranded-DNA-specific exonuclease RecJ n=1 Tax=Trichlorobacter sp. TaxID=2911007 RepID=UPI002A3693A2|nr:single-stranded-DNA-specific exonuclease RecJ [Trichlorobacter sp.]MDY0383436.1 single-stranded-DNA-specific exonuclease RecJ [Trichlorobacter sp.]
MQTSWILQKSDPAVVSALMAELQLQSATARVLAVRGFDDPAKAREFLAPTLAGMVDPFLLAGMDPAVTRLLTARSQQEQLCVYGDYDVDGVTATALMVSGLTALGLRVGYHIPHRMDDGYGLNSEALRAIRSQGATLCVSVDCGVTGIAEAQLCREIGLDLIITDHHQTLEHLPEAVAVINPHRPDCPYPFKGLAGVGVAFNLLVALRSRLREQGAFGDNGPDLRQWLDLVALGTVADVVPLLGQNRLLVASGLQRMGNGTRIGLSALKQVSGISGDVTAGQVGFRLAPRLNAAGRLESAVPGVELLLTDDRSLADRLAQELNDANNERQSVERRILDEAVQLVEQSGGVNGRYSIVLASENWHPGVVGIVASRLVERYHRPTILMAIQEDGTAKGSGRSISGFHLLDALHACAPLLLRYGGHRVAAGVSLKVEQVAAFIEAFEQAAASRLDQQSLVPSLLLDVELEPEELTTTLVDDLQRLAPFGAGNPEPVVCIRGLRVLERKVVGSDHLRLRLARGRQQINAIAWRMAGRHLPELIDVAGMPEIDTWGGRARLQLRVKDFTATEQNHAA